MIGGLCDTHLLVLVFRHCRSAIALLRISSMDMPAKRLMPIHIQQHLEALGKIASVETQYEHNWSLGLSSWQGWLW